MSKSRKSKKRGFFQKVLITTTAMSAPYAALEAEEAYLAPDNSNAGILEITIDNTLIDSSHIDDDYNVFSDAAGQQPIATGKVLADFAEGDTLYTNLDGNNDPSQVRLTPSSFANSVRIESDINIQNSADALEFSIPDGKTVFFDGNLTALADTSVSKTGDGLLEISADNSSSFAGDFSIQAGQVTLKSAADLGGNLSIELPATLLAEGSLSADSIAISGHALLKGSTTVSAEITGSGVLDINSQGSIILDSASSTFDGPISVKDGTLEFAGQKVGGSIALSNDTELKFNSASITSFDKDITGAGKVIIGSTQADITLSGLNTYTGGTKIDAATTLKLEDNALQGHVEITGADGVLQIQITEPSKVYSGNISGLGSLEVLTGSNVALTGNLTHTGGTTIAAGAIIQLSDGPISTLGDIASSGTIDFNHTTSNTNYNFSSDISEGDAGKGSIIKSSNQPLTLSGNNSYVSLNITDGNMTLSGSALDVDADINIAKKTSTLTISPTVNTTFNGDITGLGELKKAGSAKLRLDGNNLYEGETIIEGGGVLEFTNSLPGDVTITSGTLSFDNSVVREHYGFITGAGSVEVNGSQKLSLLGLNDYSGGTTIDTGSALQLNENSFILSGDYTNNGNMILVLDNDDKVYTGEISGNGLFVKSGVKNLTLNSAQTYTGATTILAGTISYGTDGAIHDASNIDIYKGATLNIAGFNDTVAGLRGEGTLIVEGSASHTGFVVNNNDSDTLETFSGNIIIRDNSTYGGNLTIKGPNTTSMPLNSIMDVEQHSTFEIQGGNVTHGGSDNPDGTYSVVNLAGKYKVRSSGADNSTAIFKSKSILNVSSQSSATIDSQNDNNNVTIDGAKVMLDTSLASGTLGTVSGDYGIKIAAGGMTLHAGTGQELTIDTPLSGDGALHITGAGVHTLTGKSTYLGVTNLNEGILNVDENFTPSSSAFQFSNFSQLNFDVSANKNSSHLFTLSGDGHLHKKGSGTLLFANQISHNGDVVVEGGTLKILNEYAHDSKATVSVSAGATLYFGADSTILPEGNSFSPINLGTIQMHGATINTRAMPASATSLVVGSKDDPATFTLTENGLVIDTNINVLFNNNITGSGLITKVGSGSLIFDRLHSVATGNITASAGSIIFNENFAAPGDINISGGASVIFKLADDLTIANTVSGAGSIHKNGSGRLIFNGADMADFAGTLFLDQGDATLKNIDLSHADAIVDVAPHTELLVDLQSDVTTLKKIKLSNNGALRAVVDPAGTLHQLSIGTMNAENGARLIVDFDPAQTDGFEHDAPVVVKDFSFIDASGQTSTAVGNKLFLEFRPLYTAAGAIPNATTGNIYPLIELDPTSQKSIGDLANFVQLVAPVVYDVSLVETGNLTAANKYYGQQYGYNKKIYVKLSDKSFTRASLRNPSSSNVTEAASVLDVLGTQYNEGTSTLQDAIAVVSKTITALSFNSSMSAMTPALQGYLTQSLFDQRSVIDDIGTKHVYALAQQQGLMKHLRQSGLDKELRGQAQLAMKQLSMSDVGSHGANFWQEKQTKMIQSKDKAMKQHLTVNLTGVKTDLSDTVSIGFQGMSAKSTYSLSEGRGAGSVDSHYVQGFSTIQLNNDAEIALQVETGMHRIQGDRHITMIDNDNVKYAWTASQNRQAFESKVHAQFSKAVHVSENTSIAPQLTTITSVHYAPGYQETGAGDLGLRVNAHTAVRSIVGLGFNASSVQLFKKGWTALTFGCGYEHDLKIHQKELEYGFGDYAPTARYMIQYGDQGGFKANLGLQLGFNQGVMVNTQYQFKADQAENHHAVRAQVSYSF